MAIVVYWSQDKKPVGKTYGMAAVVTYMSIKHNCKILGVETGFMNNSLEKCFWDVDENVSVSNEFKSRQIGIENGIEDLIRATASNKISAETISNYTKIVFKKRLDILLSPRSKIYDEYKGLLGFYCDILKLANQYYDFVFLDLDYDFPDAIKQQILGIADIVVTNITQSMKSINNIIDLKRNNELSKFRKSIICLQNADMNSKYNKKNITRYLRERDGISVVPHNTLFFESCDSSKISDFFFKIKMRNENSLLNENSMFIQEIDNMVQEILLRIN